ncbi:MAG TPA: ABC transporter permease [Solirubrobacterales bacterium]|jgi:ABC-2 type transport system permease protein
MSDVGLVLIQARYAILATLRTPRALLFGALFPIIFLLLFNSLFTQGGDQTTTVAGHTIDVHAYFTAGLIAYALALSCFTTPLMTLVAARERGQLKRQRGMPPPAWTFVAAQVLRSVAFALAVGGVMIAIGIIFYGVDLPAQTVPGFIIALALGTATLSALGIAATALAKNEDSAQPIGAFTVVMLSFVSGIFIALDTLPNFLQEVGRLFPLYHLAQGLQSTVAMNPSGIGLSGGDAAALVIWGLGGIWIATRRFKWEPQGRATE